MKPYITFTKKGLFIIFSVFVCVGFICCRIHAASNNVTDAKTNADRMSFIQKLGYIILSDQPEQKTICIPYVFYDVYENYNTLQRAAGYDLELYKGCEVMIYSYKIKPPTEQNGECVINLIVYNDRVIGGDVSSVALGGFMLPLKQEKK